MRLLCVDNALAKAWDDYVIPRSTTVTDIFAWRHVLWDAYRTPSHFIAVEEQGAWVGALGLFEIKHPFFGHYLTTAAFANDGGFYYEHPQARDLLIGKARDLAQKLAVDYLLIRTRGVALDGFSLDRHYRTAVLDMQEGADAVWRQKLLSKARNQVRRGEKEGFTLQRGPEQRRAFYLIFHSHMRDLGSPAHGQAFYRAISKYLGDKAQFIVVRDGQDLVAGALLFEVNGTAMNLHTVALKKYNRRCPNYLLYWDMIRQSCIRGNRQFDMGRSEAGSSGLSFKQNWGAKPLELTYNYHLTGVPEIPYPDPRNPRYRLAIALWQRLPLGVTRFLGPKIIRGIA